MRPVTDRIKELCDEGLTATMVVADFLRRRLAPLWQRNCPTWAYSGINNIGRTCVGPDSVPNGDELLIMVEQVLRPNPRQMRLLRRELALTNNPDLDSIFKQFAEFDEMGIKTKRKGAVPWEPKRRRPPAGHGKEATVPVSS